MTKLQESAVSMVTELLKTDNTNCVAEALVSAINEQMEPGEMFDIMANASSTEDVISECEAWIEQVTDPEAMAFADDFEADTLYEELQEQQNAETNKLS